LTFHNQDARPMVQNTPPPAHPFPNIHNAKEQIREPTTDRKPSPRGDGPNRIVSTEATPAARPGQHIGKSGRPVQKISRPPARKSAGRAPSRAFAAATASRLCGYRE